MPLVTTTFNQKTLIRIAMVIAFVQFTNALEYMMFSPVFTFMAADFAVPVTFSGYVSGMYIPVCFFVTRPSHGATKYGYAVGGMCNYRIRNPNYCHHFAKETG